MNYKNKLLAVFFLFISVSISAFAEYKPMKMPGAQGMKMGMSQEMKDKQAIAIQQYILKRDELSDQIRDKKNGQKKQALMDKQLQLIKEAEEKKRAMKRRMMKKHHQKMMKMKAMKM